MFTFNYTEAIFLLNVKVGAIVLKICFNSPNTLIIVYHIHTRNSHYFSEALLKANPLTYVSYEQREKPTVSLPLIIYDVNIRNHMETFARLFPPKLPAF